MSQQLVTRKGGCIMEILEGDGESEYGKGIQINLTGNEIAIAVDAYLVAHGVTVEGARTISVNGVKIDRNNTDKFKIIRPKDFKIDVYKRGGQSGFDPNPKMEIKITHLPTRIERVSFAGRSQHQNKAIAMEALKLELEKLGWKNEK